MIQETLQVTDNSHRSLAQLNAADAAKIAASADLVVTITESGNKLDDAAIELGVYFVLVSVCTFLLLDRVKGNLRRLQGWIIYRRLEVNRHVDGNPQSVTMLLRVASYLYLVMPILALLGWFVLILFDTIQESKPIIPAFAILMMAISLWLILLGVFQLQWRNYRLKMLSQISGVMVFVLVTTYQFVTVFGYEKEQELFLPISILFLNLSALLIGPIIFVHSFEEQDSDVMSLFLKFFPKTGQKLDPDRTDDIQQEIAEQRKNPDWKASYEDLADMVTMSQVSFAKFKEMLGNGWLGKYKALNKCGKLSIKIGFVVFAYLLLVGYSLLLYFLDDKSKLGIIISVSVFCMDLFNVLLVLTGNLTSSSTVTVLLIANRAFMVGLGENYWLYGFMILYMIYALVFVYQITKTLFPFESDVVQHERSLVDLVKGGGDKKSALERLREGVNPLWLLLILTLEYIVLLIIVEFVDFEGKKLIYLQFGNGVKLETYQAAGLTFYIVLTFYLIFSLGRVMYRRATKCERYNTGATDGLDKCKAVDRMLFYIIFLSLVSCGWGVIFFLMFKSNTMIIYATVGVPSVLLFGRALVFLRLNDFDYFQDVEMLNKTIDAHNKKIDELEKKKDEVRKQLADGSLVLPVLAEDGEEPASAADPNATSIAAQADNNQVAPEPESLDASEGEQPAPQPSQPQPANPASPGVRRQPTVNTEEAKRKQAEEQRKMIERIQQDEKKKREEQERRKREQSNNAAQQEEAERKKRMEEQRKLEQARKAEREAAAAAQRKAEQEQKARQQAEELKKQKEAQKAQNVSSGDDNKYHFSGKAQTSGIVDYSKVKVKSSDVMYEGGDDTVEPINPTGSQGSVTENQKLVPDQENSATVASSADGDDELLDMDVLLDQEGGHQRMAHSKLRRIVDWRLMHNGSWVKAFCARDLRPNDYRFVISVSVSAFLWLLLEICLLVFVDGETGGISALPFLYIGVCAMVSLAAINQGRPLRIVEYIVYIVINVIYIGVGVAFFIIKYEVSTFTIDVEKKSLQQELASYFVLLYCLMPPTLAHLLVIILKAADMGFGEVVKNFKYFMIATIIGLILILVSLFLFVSWVEGVAALGGLILITYTIVQLFLYVSNGFSLDGKWVLANRILATIAVLASFAVSVGVPSLSLYQGASFSCLTLLIMIWFFAIFHLIVDLRESTEKPVYYSLTLFPIYKYDPKNLDVKPHIKVTGAWLASFVLLAGWAFLTAHQVRPHWVGVIILCLIVDLTLLTFMGAQEITLNSMIDAKAFIDEEMAKKAWLDAKAQYLKDQGSFARDQVMTYRKLWIQRQMVQNHLHFLLGETPKPPPATTNAEVKDMVWMGTDLEGLAEESKFYVEDLTSQYNNLRVDDPFQVSMVLFDVQQRLKRAYLQELELIVVFLLTMAQNARVYRIREINRFFKFLDEMKFMLHALGIHILVPSAGDAIQRNRDVQAQIEELDPEQKKLFEQIRELHEINEEARRAGGAAARAKQEELLKKRRERSEQERRKKEEELAKLREKVGDDHTANADIPDAELEAMPDCQYKYKCILARAKAGKGKYTDKKFGGNNDSLGESVISNNLGGTAVDWVRMSENPDHKFALFVDGVDVNDVVQGALGNCYYLSALGVLGSQKTHQMFFIVNDYEEWRECGALCIKFYEDGREDYVIIDDLLPMVSGMSRFPFVTSPSHVELWPHFLEKAYAKKAGSYGGIEGGFVDAALTDLTNGVPETWDFQEHQNPTKLWNKVKAAKEEGALLGAGSPSHEDGDRARSSKGIVQGHAYSLIQCCEVDGIRLVQLRNPHGEGEWTGDWGDDSSKWTARMKNLLNYKETAEDGIFWMQWSDFLDEFESVYVSRQFSKADGWESVIVDDEWKGKYAAGLPHKNNPHKVIFHNNPQYTFEVAEPSEGYFILRMKDKETMSKSKLYSYFLVENNRGDVIMRPEKSKTLATLSPINQVIRSTTVTLDKNFDYPLKITALIANMNTGAEGEGSFNIQFFIKGKVPPKLEKIN